MGIHSIQSNIVGDSLSIVRHAPCGLEPGKKFSREIKDVIAV